MFSIVIPTYHRNELLEACLKHLAPTIQQLSVPYEVLVSDDGTQTTAKSLIAEKYDWATWIEGPHTGPAANRNSGANQAKYNWIVFVDDDCLPDASFLKAYLKAIETHPEVQVFEGKIYADRAQNRFDEESPINLKGGKLLSCNFCIHKTVFQALNGFDQSFPYAAMEDTDFNIRVKHAGYKIVFVSEAAVCHPWRRVKGWNIYKKRYESYKYLISKHPDKNLHNPVSRLKIMTSRFGNGVYSLAQYRFKGTSNLVYRTAIDVLLLFVR